MTHRSLSILLASFVVFLSVVAAQAQLMKPNEKPGTVTTEKNHLNENLDHIPAQQLVALKEVLQKIQAIAAEDPLLKNPVGYSVQMGCSYSKPPVLHVPSQKQLVSTLFFDFGEFYTDRSSGQIVQDKEFSGGIRITVNDLLFPSDAGPDNNMADAGYPVPYFFHSTTSFDGDSTADYTQLTLHSSLPYRVLTNHRPLFAPLTRQQYLTYQVALEKYYTEKIQSQLTDQQEGFATSRQRFEAYVKQGAMRKGELDSLMKTLQEAVDGWKTKLAQSRRKLSGYQAQLASLSASEKDSPAYIDFGKQDDDRLDLVSSDDPNKVGLFTPNPAYFNNALPSTNIQLITVRLSYHPTMTSPFMKEKINAAFQQLDYKKLKALLQK